MTDFIPRKIVCERLLGKAGLANSATKKFKAATPGVIGNHP
jgi:hypothetical protein